MLKFHNQGPHSSLQLLSDQQHCRPGRPVGGKTTLGYAMTVEVSIWSVFLPPSFRKYTCHPCSNVHNPDHKPSDLAQPPLPLPHFMLEVRGSAPPCADFRQQHSPKSYHFATLITGACYGVKTIGPWPHWVPSPSCFSSLQVKKGMHSWSGFFADFRYPMHDVSWCYLLINAVSLHPN